MKIKKYQNPSSPLTAYDKEIETYANRIKNSQSIIDSRKKYIQWWLDDSAAKGRPLTEQSAKIKTYNNRGEKTDDTFAVRWYTERLKARPDLVTEEDLNYIKDRLATVRYTNPESVAQHSADYVKNGYQVPEQYKEHPDVFISKLDGLNVDEFKDSTRVTPKIMYDSVLSKINNSDYQGKYTPETHTILINYEKSEIPGNYPANLVKTHEQAHAYQLPFLKQLKTIAEDFGIDTTKDKNALKELHSRLMTFRQDYRINPYKKYTLDDILELKKQIKQNREDIGVHNFRTKTYHDHGLIHYYPDAMIVRMLNEVGSNTNQNRFIRPGSMFNQQNSMDNIPTGTTFAKRGTKLWK